MTETSPADLRLAAQMHLRDGRFADSAAAYRVLVEAEPHAPDLRYGLGAALSAAGDEAGASDAWSTARVFHGLALLRELGVDMERFAADPDYAAETGRGLAANGLPGVAGAALARAVETLGPQPRLLADYATCLLHQGAQEEACEVLSLASEADAPALASLLMTAYAFADDNGLRRSLLARQSGSAIEAAAAPLAIHPAAPPGERTLKVGYVPGAATLDMRYLAVIASHDPKRVAALLLVEDLQAAPEGFAARSIGGLSDEAAAKAIAAMDLDILIDLSGPAGGRLGVFAYRPAPLQIVWNSDYASTGLTRIDAKILPAGVVERDVSLAFSETCIALGPVLAPWRPVEISPRQGKGRFTFGAFMPPALMTGPVVAALAEIAIARPDARLMIKHPVMDDPVIQRMLAAKFLSCGLPRERLDFRGMSGDDLDIFDFESVDLAIDSRPSMGEAQVLTLLGHGVPVLCVGGPTTSGRLAVSPLVALGLQELTVVSFKHLVTRALELSEQPERLAAIRDKIEAAFANSAYSDVRRIADDLQGCFDALTANKAASAGKSAAA
jgi:predicted O-linked N-acetylglucosamine transferase (SPINDLY family)